MSNHSDLSYQPSEAGQQPVANNESGPQPIDTGTPPQNVPTLPTNLPTVGQDDHAGDEDRTSLHGSAERLNHTESRVIEEVDEIEEDLTVSQAPTVNIRYKLLMQMIRVFDSKFTGGENENIDDWFHRLEFFIRPHALTSAEKAYILVNCVKDRAFSILTEGDSTNYEELKRRLMMEYRKPGAYNKSIQEFVHAKQGCLLYTSPSPRD